MLLTKCPYCGSDDLHAVLAYGRLNRQICDECSWRSYPFIPATREVTGTKTLSVGAGYHFSTFDKYGQACTSSKGYGTASEAHKDMMEELDAGRHREGGPYTGVLWPPTAQVKGIIFT